MPVLEMNANPINSDVLQCRSLRRLWDRSETIDDAVVNFELGMLQLEHLHVHKDDRQWVFLNTFSAASCVRGGLLTSRRL